MTTAESTTDTSTPISVVFVCTGNICRSPMAEYIARGRARELTAPASFSSAGISDEEQDNPIDRRAERQLTADGYAVGAHRARKITRADIAAADIVIGLEQVHVRALQRLAPDASIHLLSDFDPGTPDGQGVPDPWYGGPEGFRTTASAIEAAIPGIFAAIEAMAQRRANQP